MRGEKLRANLPLFWNNDGKDRPKGQFSLLAKKEVFLAIAGGPLNHGRGPDLTACLVGLRSYSQSHRGRCSTRMGPKYLGSLFWTESLHINVGYTNFFSICFFFNTYDTVHIVLIKIHRTYQNTYRIYNSLQYVLSLQRFFFFRNP